MKKKDIEAFRNKKKGEMEKELAKKKKELALAFSKLKAGKEKNLKKARLLRKEIAQILTIIKEREIIETEKPKEK